jgi:hypothetical protein
VICPTEQPIYFFVPIWTAVIGLKMLANPVFTRTHSGVIPDVNQGDGLAS